MENKKKTFFALDEPVLIWVRCFNGNVKTVARNIQTKAAATTTEKNIERKEKHLEKNGEKRANENSLVLRIEKSDRYVYVCSVFGVCNAGCSQC